MLRFLTLVTPNFPVFIFHFFFLSFESQQCAGISFWDAWN